LNCNSKQAEEAKVGTEKIARFIIETSNSEIPPEAMQTAMAGIADCIGVTLAALNEPLSRKIVEFVREMGGTSETGVIGAGFKTSSYFAALANGAAAHALDYDDMHRMWLGHPSVALVPAVLAVAQKLGSSGRETLEAYIIGFETGSYLGTAAGAAHYQQGWHSTSTLGSVAAAASVARLLKLDLQQTRMALGIAASWAGGLRQNFGSMTKPLHAGAAASNGVLAGLLARKGFTADENILETPLGYARAFGDSDPNWEKADQQLEHSYSIVTHPTIFKLYPSCGCTHPSIEATQRLMKENRLNADEIVDIEVNVSPVEPTICIHQSPKTALEGKFSLKYGVAVSVLDGQALLPQYTDERAGESSVQKLIQHIKVVESYPTVLETGQEKMPQTVKLRLKDGRELSQEIIYPKGTSRNPISTEEFNNKYLNCVSLVLSKGHASQSLELLQKLDQLESIDDVMDIVTCEGS
jgi:2-methylcitrate dehydratase PrpD